MESLPTLDEVLDGQSPANSSPIRVDFVPGTNQRYSGGGFTVAQQLIQDITNEPFEDALDDLVLRPRGMTNSTFEQPLPIDRESEAASGHDRTGSVIPGRWHIHPEKAAAGLWSTPSDLARLVLSIQRSAAGQDGEVLLPATTQEMLATQMGPSGLGFVVLGEGDGRIFRHGGANVGFRALVVGYASGSHGAVVMTNGENGMELIDEIVASVARVYEWPDR